ncbi:MAG: InlB B-repeat-containing protein [Endomicrobiaceae bacterium]|nr:InlB B-repeat-containing protein [Endomicrobiaceae bacterium]
MKKIFLLLLFISVFVLVGCGPSKVNVTFDLNYESAPAAPEAQAIEKKTKAVEPPAPTREGYVFKGWFEDKVGSKKFDFNTLVGADITLYAKWESEPDYSPIVTGNVYHWVPNAFEANVTATLDLNTADASSLTISIGETELEEFIGYELVDGELTIFGTALDELNLALGDHTVTVTTSLGSAEFTIGVVKNAALGSSIPKETIKGLDMNQIDSYVPTEVITGAPELMITEVSVDMGEYSYIELFNNTSAPYNLKNHRIVFADLTKQTQIVSLGLFEQPLGMGSGMFIYQDYVIPALSSAVIWLVGSFPWTQAEGTMANGEAGRVIVEAESVQSNLFGDNPENLSIQKFRDIYSLSEEVLVFPIRTQACLVNSLSASTDDGLGAAPIKGASSQFSGVNSSIANRGFQIQKFDLDKQIPVSGVDGVAYYKYDVGVLNREDDLYVDGVLDRTKMTIFGGRETINAFYARRALYNSDDELVGYACGANGIDLYNAGKAGYLLMYEEIVTPLSTALIYANYVDDVAEKWGPLHSLEYTVPAEGTLMLYIPLKGMKAVYEEALASESPLKLMGLAPEVDEISASHDIEVPISDVYPKDYLATGYNTIGRLISFNFVIETD